MFRSRQVLLSPAELRRTHQNWASVSFLSTLCGELRSAVKQSVLHYQLKVTAFVWVQQYGWSEQTTIWSLFSLQEVAGSAIPLRGHVEHLVCHYECSDTMMAATFKNKQKQQRKQKIWSLNRNTLPLGIYIFQCATSAFKVCTWHLTVNPAVKNLRKLKISSATRPSTLIATEMTVTEHLNQLSAPPDDRGGVQLRAKGASV